MRILENWGIHLSERMCVREKRAMEISMKAVSQVTRALIRWRYTAQHTSTGGTVTGYVPDPYAMFVYVRKPTVHGFLYIKNLQKL